MNEFNISQENWDKIIDYARIAYDNYKAEIGGMAIMMQDKDGDWHAERPVILKQEISMSNTSIDKDELAKYYTKEEYKFRISIWKPIEVAQDVELNIIGKEERKLSERMIKEVKDLCEKETPVTYLNNHNIRQGTQAALWEDVWGDTIEDDPNNIDKQEITEMLFNSCSYDPELEKLVHAIDDTSSKFVDGEIDLDTWHKRLENKYSIYSRSI